MPASSSHISRGGFPNKKSNVKKQKQGVFAFVSLALGAEHMCHSGPDPLHGHRNCSETEAAVTCSLACEDGYAFALNPQQDYFCQKFGQEVCSKVGVFIPFTSHCPCLYSRPSHTGDRRRTRFRFLTAPWCPTPGCFTHPRSSASGSSRRRTATSAIRAMTVKIPSSLSRCGKTVTCFSTLYKSRVRQAPEGLEMNNKGLSLDQSKA